MNNKMPSSLIPEHITSMLFFHCTNCGFHTEAKEKPKGFVQRCTNCNDFLAEVKTYKEMYDYENEIS